MPKPHAGATIGIKSRVLPASSSNEDMRQARYRRTLTQKKLAEQPWCIYCGGATPGTSLDHMPPIIICDDKLRPAGMEFAACKACHEGTRGLDQVAGLLCRLYPNSPSPASVQQITDLLRGIRNNHPTVYAELKPSPRQLAVARQALGVMKDGAAAFNIGDNTHGMMLRFGARAAMALHHHLTGEIVPEAGGVWSTWHTNERLITGDFPSDFADMLPPSRTLRAGRNTLEGQFDFASRVTDDNQMSAHMLTFRLSFAVQAVVARNISALDRVQKRFPQLIFKTGFLKATS
jgi:hypothetical protein